MPIYEVKDKSGETYELDVPDGVDPATVASRLFPVASPAMPDRDRDRAITRSEIKGVGVGVARAALGAGQLLERGYGALTGTESNIAGDLLGKMDTARAAERKELGVSGYDWPQLAGEVLGPSVVLAPISAATWMGRIGQGAMKGGAAALTQPVTSQDYWTEKAKQGATGAAFGATGQGLVEGARGIGAFLKSAAEPAYDAGRKAILLREIDELAPASEPARKATIKALEGAEELVPGARPTAGQAVSKIPEATALSSYQRASSRVNPESQKFYSRQIAQERARAKSLENLAGGEAEMAAAKNVRAADAARNYSEAFSGKIELDDTWKEISARPSIKQAMSIAADIAKESGGAAKFDDVASVGDLHNVKLALDGMVRNPEMYALGKAQQQAVEETRTAFVDWLAQKSPEYEKARSEFAKASEPINRMEVLQYLKARLNPALGNRESAAAFTKAVEDAPQTLKKSTGYARYRNLDEVLAPEELRAVQNVAADLRRTAAYARQSMATSAESIAQRSGQKLPNLLSRPAMITNAILRSMGKDADAKINAMAAEMFLNPEKLAAALKESRTKPARIVADSLVQRITNMGLVGGAVAAAEQPAEEVQ